MRTKLIASAFVALLALGAVACEEPAEVEDDGFEDGIEEEEDFEDDGLDDDMDDDEDGLEDDEDDEF